MQLAGTKLETETELREPYMMAYKPALAVYAVQSSDLQVLGRFGAGYSDITATRTVQVPCALVDECTMKDAERDVRYRGLTLDASVVAQIHFGQREGRKHPVLWARAQRLVHRTSDRKHDDDRAHT